MRPISAWQHMMSGTITIEPRTGRDVNQMPTYGTAVAYPMHLSRRRQMVRNPRGEEVLSNQAAYLGTAANVDIAARVTLSTGDVGSTEAFAIHPTIVAVERRFDQSGPHHVVLYFGNANDIPNV